VIVGTEWKQQLVLFQADTDWNLPT